MTGTELSHAGSRRRGSVGSLVAACLRQQGVELVFGIPGTHNLEIYRGLREQNIEHVLVRHEQGGTYAATGYAWVSRKPGVVIATTGPGVTNCITGLANAHADSIPLLVISPGAPMGQERRGLGFLHESKDQRAGIDGFVGESIRAETAEAVVEAVQRVFHGFRVGRPRAMHIEVPLDLLTELVDEEAPPAWPVSGAAPVAADVQRAARMLAQAERPLVIAGGGASGAAAALTELVDRTGIPFLTTVHGKGVVDEQNPHSLGALAGGIGGFSLIAEADAILAVGTELKNERTADGVNIIRVDIDRAQLHRHHAAAVPLLGDAGEVVESLQREPALQDARVTADWQAHAASRAREVTAAAVEDWGQLHRAVLDGIADAGMQQPLLTGDSSRVSWIGTVRAAPLSKPLQFITTDGFATLGFSLPAAIGAKLADRRRGVVALLGDGALMFTAQELATASEQRLGIPVVIIDNGGYGEIKQNMVDADMEPFGVDLASPNYDALATAFGSRSTAAKTPAALRAAVAAALQEDCPTLIVVRQDDLDSDTWRVPQTDEEAHS